MCIRVPRRLLAIDRRRISLYFFLIVLRREVVVRRELLRIIES